MRPDDPKSEAGADRLRILIADDHAILRQSLASMLRMQPGWDVCQECADGEAALEGIRVCEPDVVILDHSMPKLTGVEVLRGLEKDGSGARVIILSSFGSGLLVSEGIRAGAAGWVVKEDAFEELVRAVAVVLQGELFLSPAVDREELREAEQSTPVSPREMDVLRGLASGLSAKEVAAAHGLSPRPVETHRTRLMVKLSARNSMDLLQKAMQAGLLESHP